MSERASGSPAHGAQGPTHRGAQRRDGRLRGWLRGLSATLVAGLVVLALGLLLAWLVAGTAGSPGPGPLMLVGHGVGVAVAVLLQRTARRREDALGCVAAFGPAAVLVVLGLLFWWN